MVDWAEEFKKKLSKSTSKKKKVDIDGLDQSIREASDQVEKKEEEGWEEKEGSQREESIAEEEK